MFITILFGVLFSIALVLGVGLYYVAECHYHREEFWRTGEWDLMFRPQERQERAVALLDWLEDRVPWGIGRRYSRLGLRYYAALYPKHWSESYSRDAEELR